MTWGEKKKMKLSNRSNDERKNRIFYGNGKILWDQIESLFNDAFAQFSISKLMSDFITFFKKNWDVPSNTSRSDRYDIIEWNYSATTIQNLNLSI